MQILEAFAKADADGGGALEVAELRQVLRTLNSAVTEDEVQAIFARCDPSGDGHVTLAELLKAKRQAGKKKGAAPRLPLAANAPPNTTLAVEERNTLVSHRSRLQLDLSPAKGTPPVAGGGAPSAAAPLAEQITQWATALLESARNATARLTQRVTDPSRRAPRRAVSHDASPSRTSSHWACPMPRACLICSCAPRLGRRYTTIEETILEAKTVVGAVPSGRTWKDEWIGLCVEQAKLDGVGAAFTKPSRYASPGGEERIELKLKCARVDSRPRLHPSTCTCGPLTHLHPHPTPTPILDAGRRSLPAPLYPLPSSALPCTAAAVYAPAIDWKVANGWERKHAEAYTLLSCCGVSALSRALEERDNRYVASVHVLMEALCTRAALLLPVRLKIGPSAAGGGQQVAGKRAPIGATAPTLEVPPMTYVNLNGTFGLVDEDAQWRFYVAESLGDVQVGLRFSTHSLVTATANAQCFTDAAGFGVPLELRGEIQFVPQDSPVVCFISRPTEAAVEGRPAIGRSLIQSAGSSYDLPPLATVELEERRAAGTWQAFGVTVQQELLVFGCAFAVPVQRKKALRNPAKDSDEARAAAAAKIQAIQRGRIVRLQMHRPDIRIDSFEIAFARDQKRARERERAAIRIQAAHRGGAARRAYRTRMLSV